MCYSPVCRGSEPTRLACLRHAASVHPEPGSNSLFCIEIIFPERKMKRFWLFLLSELMPIRIKIFIYFTKFEIVKVLYLKHFCIGQKKTEIYQIPCFYLTILFYVSSIPILYHLCGAVKSRFKPLFSWKNNAFCAIMYLLNI